MRLPSGPAVSLSDFPSTEEIVREARRHGFDTLYREPSPDRPALSANDWYGLGFVYGMTGRSPSEGQRVHWYCSKSGAYEQYKLGARHARFYRLAVKP